MCIWCHAVVGLHIVAERLWFVTSASLGLVMRLNSLLCPAVFMGMGEPLLNLKAVMAAVNYLNSAVGIGARHITISTVGVPQAIVRLAGYGTQARPASCAYMRADSCTRRASCVRCCAA